MPDEGTVGQVTKERVTTRSFRQTLAYIPAREQADETRAKVLRKMKPRRVGSNLGKLSTRQRGCSERRASHKLPGECGVRFHSVRPWRVVEDISKALGQSD